MDAGGVVVEVLQTAYGGEPTGQDLDAWIAGYQVTVSSVIDRDLDAETETYAALGIREQTFIVELATMKVVWQVNGSILGIGESSAMTGINQILGML